MKKVLFFLCVMFFLSSAGQVSAETIQLMIGTETNTQAYRICTNIAAALSDKMGTPIELVYRPHKRMYHELMEGRNFQGVFIGKDGFEKEGPHLIKIPQPVVSSPFFAFATSDTIKINGWKSLADYKVIYKSGIKFIEENLEKNRILSTYPIDSRINGIKFLLAGRADVFVDAPLLMLQVLETSEFKDKGIVMLKPAVDESLFYTYFDNKYADIAKKYAKALDELTADGTRERIIKETK